MARLEYFLKHLSTCLRTANQIPGGGDTSNEKESERVSIVFYVLQSLHSAARTLWSSNCRYVHASSAVCVLANAHAVFFVFLPVAFLCPFVKVNLLFVY